MSSFGFNLATKNPVYKYFQNGGGRDSYIYSNNGGFTASTSPIGIEKPSTMYQPIKAGPSAAIYLRPAQSKALHYVQNGQGRDTYIMANNGGFTSSGKFQSGKSTYFSQLRKYEMSPGLQKMTISNSMSRKLSLASLNSGGTSERSRSNSPQQKSNADIFQESQFIISNQRDIQRILQLSKEQRTLTKKLSQPKFPSINTRKIMQIEEPVFEYENSANKNYVNLKLGSQSVLTSNAYNLSKQERRYRKVDKKTIFDSGLKSGAKSVFKDRRGTEINLSNYLPNLGTPENHNRDLNSSYHNQQKISLKKSIKPDMKIIDSLNYK